MINGQSLRWPSLTTVQLGTPTVPLTVGCLLALNLHTAPHLSPPASVVLDLGGGDTSPAATARLHTLASQLAALGGGRGAIRHLELHSSMQLAMPAAQLAALAPLAPSLTSLKLAYKTLGVEGASSLAAALPGLQHLHLSYLANTPLDLGVLVVPEVMPTLSTLCVVHGMPTGSSCAGLITRYATQCFPPLPGKPQPPAAQLAAIRKLVLQVRPGPGDFHAVCLFCCTFARLSALRSPSSACC
jgi:hypothetical protein